MFAFNYHRPETLDLALETLGANEEAKLLAGGQTLISTLKQRLRASRLKRPSCSSATPKPRMCPSGW